MKSVKGQVRRTDVRVEDGGCSQKVINQVADSTPTLVLLEVFVVIMRHVQWGNR